jgi:transcriptional regulator with XRE-family HTH domain
MTPKQHTPISDQLRALIAGCGVNLATVARLTLIDLSTLTRFMAGERGLSMKALDRLGKALGLHVTAAGIMEPKRKGR